MAKQTYSISELAAEFGVTTRTIRFYEEKGLVRPRREGQRRLFSNADRVRIKLILRGKRIGMTLQESADIIDLYDPDHDNTTQLHSLLSTVMARRERLSWEEVVTLGQQLCAALQHAHEKGIIHRDLKPSNLMVLADGTVKLTDFGIAKDLDETGLTATNCTVGTASYMSPEQCKGEKNIGPRSDLYSMGVMLYELLAGALPHRRDALTLEGLVRSLGDETVTAPSLALRQSATATSRMSTPSTRIAPWLTS